MTGRKHAYGGSYLLNPTHASTSFGFVTIRFSPWMALLAVHADAHVVMDGFSNPSMLLFRRDPSKELGLPVEHL